MKTTTARLALFTAAVSTAFLFAASTSAAAAIENPKSKIENSPRGHQPLVQLALLLDTSNSMDGLIDQARTRLWQVVNDLATAKQGGARPRLEVALYEYGNSGLSQESGYIRQVAAFTDDLDDISAKLFALRTNGGDEFCGAVIDRALDQLAWSKGSDDLKLIFIAGNEPFTQGRVDFHEPVRAAVARGITVNTIFCGPAAEGVQTGWKDGAVLADGTFASIDQDQRMPDIAAPQDKEIAELNARLNTTYVAFGAAGRARAENQVAQDMNAAAASPTVAAQRASAKASALYTNSSWDLVDAVNEGRADLATMKNDELPEEFRKLAPAERQAKIAAMTAERKQIQERIRTLSTERDAYVTEQMKTIASSNNATALDDAIRNSVRAQAAKLKYEFTAP